MAPLKMHATAGNKNAAKALIAAEYNGVKIDKAPFEMGVTNKTPAFLKLNPLGKARGWTGTKQSGGHRCPRFPAAGWPRPRPCLCLAAAAPRVGGTGAPG